MGQVRVAGIGAGYFSQYHYEAWHRLAGAELVLLDSKARKESIELVKKITYVELNVNQEFMNRFSGAKFIPHTDHTLFPSVPFFGDD